MKKILVTGANRGIGLELCRQLLQQQNKVLATYRIQNASDELFLLNELSENLHLFQLDVNSSESVTSAIDQISKQFDSIDIVINNAGILDWSSLEDVSTDSFLEIYQTNVIGTFRVSKATLSLLKKSPNPFIVNLSSRLGSISLRGRTQLGGAIAYQCSKTALNMLTKQMSIDYEKFGIRVISISPGWVKTDMGGENAFYEVSESVTLLLAQINELTPSMNGIFIGENGQEIPW